MRYLLMLLLVAGCAIPARAQLSVQQGAARLAGQNITGVTIITHGFTATNNGGGYMLPLAQDIRGRLGTAGANAWLFDYDLTSDGGTGVFATGTSVLPAAGASGLSGHVVLLYDWAPESNETSPRWGESSGDALFAIGVELGLFDPLTRSAPPVQFIAHSFGTAVTSEAVERLAGYGVTVDQVTLIDPHDFDQSDVPTYDQAARLFDLGKPAGYGVTMWDNVAESDVYYQTRGNQGGLSSLVTADPEGRPIPGATNRLLDAADELPPGNPYGTFSTDSDHGYAWNTFYRGTVLGARPAGTAASATPNFNYNTTGWAHSIHNPSRVPLPAPAFFGPGQDHEHTESLLSSPNGTPNTAGLASLGLTSETINTARFAPDYQPGTIVNGGFDDGAVNSTLVAGWNHHGGGGDSGARIVESGPERFLRLNGSAESRTHNLTYIPQNALSLDFDLRIGAASSDDVLQVLVGESLLATISATTTTAGWIAQSLALPLSVRNAVETLTVRILFGGTFFNSPTIDLDNFAFTLGPPPGDYNADGFVDAADYTVWRDTLGTAGLGLAADGDLSGVVDARDYQVWRAHFGEGSAGLGAVASVPEPAGWVVAVLFAFALPTSSIRVWRT
ncbi:hypothetical protein Pla175_02350 [Pirellulimonas nuda]|uniref:Alpha/beta hydrolase family protein n=1 Tax=Pirellulimonas nuda TaxID=2528009 RepID=A0A518D5X4_9BACT|nr:hypothetical protein [Pirellulimonas nuda]QDU86881.1 hypothetical protein Pla175_02350 [Pirellulimonas nuda]